jgi:HEPN domain-containing protein
MHRRISTLRVETEPWWRQAQADLETAEWNLQGERWYAASWFAQQSAEKGLKALWLERRGELAPRTHDLQALGGELTVPDEIQAELDALEPVFKRVRYPELTGMAPIDVVNKDMAQRHLFAVQKVLAWLQSELQA